MTKREGQKAAYKTIKKGDLVILAWWDNPDLKIVLESIGDADMFVTVDPGTVALYLGKQAVTRGADKFKVDLVMSQGFVGWVYNDELTPYT